MKKVITQFRNQFYIFIVALLAIACQDQTLTEVSRERLDDGSSTSGLSDDQRFGHSQRNVYVLVHGAWHPESAWVNVKFLLEKSGHIVKTVQLPGLGKDATPVETVTFQDHVDAVRNVVLQQSQPVILVGHSYAGAVVSQVGEEAPTKIKKLIYISGQMPGDGETIAQWALADTASLVTKNLLVDAAGTVAYMTPENYGKALYNVALQGNPVMVWEAKKIISLLRPHPLSTLFVPLHLSSNYRNLPKTYISCLKDKAVTPAAQRNMYSRFPETKIYFLRGSDHSPFVTTPIELVELLKK
jgi:pimeloyl-ACP methyl ester carboxylesterase